MVMTLTGLQKEVHDAKGLDVLACSLYSEVQQKPTRIRRPWQPRWSVVFPMLATQVASRPDRLLESRRVKADPEHTLTCIAALSSAYY